MKVERNLTIPFKHLKAATWKSILNYFFIPHGKGEQEGEATERQTFVTQKHTRSNKLELHENETGDTELPVAGRIQENQMPIAKGAYSKMDQSKRREIDSLSFI